MCTLYQDGFSIIPILGKVNDDFTQFGYFVKLHNFLHFQLAIVYKGELIMSAFHERIAPLIMREREKGVSDSTMEKAMGLPAHSINKWFTGKYKSYEKYYKVIAEYFGVPVGQLLGEKENPAQANPDGEIISELIKAFEDLTPEQQLTMLAQIKAVGQLNTTQDGR